MEELHFVIQGNEAKMRQTSKVAQQLRDSDLQDSRLSLLQWGLGACPGHSQALGGRLCCSRADLGLLPTKLQPPAVCPHSGCS